MPRVFSLAALSAAFLLALTGVAFADADVTIGDDGLDPETVRVGIREAIVWTNATDADVSLVGEDPNWESGPIEPGATFSIEITQEGTYTYGSADGALSGEIVVRAADSGNDDGGNNEGGNGGQNGGENGNNNGANGGTEDEVEEVDPEMPDTGINAVVPGALSVLLIGFGGGLLRVTPKRRRTN